MATRTKISATAPEKGRDYRLETCFVGGKMRHRRIPLIEGLPVEEFLRRNADDAILVAEGHFAMLHERECERGHADPAPLFKDAEELNPF